MTTMAVDDPPLRRLFDRLDFAPRPSQARLSELLAQWEALRNERVAPRPPFARGAVAPDAFLFARRDGENDYVLERPCPSLESVLGSGEAGDTLAGAPNPRQAARLRRLFDAVIKAGEPVLAEFVMEGAGEGAVAVDLLAAPMADAEGRICGIFGGCELRAKSDGAAHRPSPARGFAGPVLFALANARPLAESVAAQLATEVAPHEERDFEDGEHKIRPTAGVRNRDVYVFADLTTSPGQSVNDKLCKLLFFVGALKQSAARSVTVVAPYLCYARKERQTKPRDPVATRHLAQVLEAVGVDCVITVTAHNLAAFQNAFRCRTEHLDTDALFAHALAGRLKGRQASVVSPDPGGEKRAELFRAKLESVLGMPVAKAFVDKTRSMGKVTGELFAGDVAGRTAIILDDMISTGGTMTRAAAACRRNGASEVIAVATHGLFVGGAEGMMRDAAINEIWVTDCVALSDALEGEAHRGRLRIVRAGDLLAGAIRRCHRGGSINELLEHDLALMS
ncbi:MAG TPA: ribose-phosphate pyrophosphokinase [Roseiarcus sp.]|nr:ribose-phosphate pyrophosphokinase [Roseiarcus sp.]